MSYETPANDKALRMAAMLDLFKVLGPAGQAIHGGDAQWHLPRGSRPGKWMPAITNVQCCVTGYHLVTVAGLIDWLRPGCSIYLAEGRGAESRDGHKTAYSQTRLLRRLTWDAGRETAWTADILERAIRHARRVLPIFEVARPGDDRLRKAIEAASVVLTALRGGAPVDTMAGRAAAARAAAAWAAAADAARAAADAARAAAWAADAAAWAAAARAAAAWAGAAAATRAADAARAAAWAAAERDWQTRRLVWYLGIGDEPPIAEGFEDE